jgi:hypothetical protein
MWLPMWILGAVAENDSASHYYYCCCSNRIDRKRNIAAGQIRGSVPLKEEEFDNNELMENIAELAFGFLIPVCIRD